MTTTTVRPAAVAGMFYPANPDALRAEIADYLAGAEPGSAPAPKAIVAPHAGLVYSGPVAASAYARIAAARDTIRRVVLLGPAHRVPFRGLALPDAQSFATPLGEVPVDGDAIALLTRFPQVAVLPAAHAAEHSLEVQLPFLQSLLGDFTLVPLVVGEATPEDVEEVLDALWGGDETLIVVSSDLSHYHDYQSARVIDAATSAAIEALDDGPIGYEQACGRGPISGLLRCARRHGLCATCIDLRNSGDTAGPRSEVVGYGAYVFQ